MTITVHHYPACDTCRNALKWLAAHDVSVTKNDIVGAPPSRAELERLWKTSALPIKRLFNTSGQSYRAGAFGARLASMSDDDALDALAADGKLIKRPLVDGGSFVLVGFDPAAYAARFG